MSREAKKLISLPSAPKKTLPTVFFLIFIAGLSGLLAMAGGIASAQTTFPTITAVPTPTVIPTNTEPTTYTGTLSVASPPGFQVVNQSIGVHIDDTFVWEDGGSPITSNASILINYSYSTRNVIGGGSAGTAAVSGNQVWLKGAFTIGTGNLGDALTAGAGTGGIFGGLSASGAVTNNKVVLQDGTVYGIVAGGAGTGSAAQNGSITNNVVSISGGSFNTVNGGGNNYTGAAALGGLVSENKVYINGGTFGYQIDGGSSTQGSVTKNQVIIQGGTFSVSHNPGIRGGHVSAGTTAAVTISENKVEFYGGTAGAAITGALGEVAGGQLVKGNGSISKNIVVANNLGISVEEIYGGQIWRSSSPNENFGTVTENEVFIYNSTTGAATATKITTAVAGGYIDGRGSFVSSHGDIDKNSVTLWGNVSAVDVWGGYSQGEYNNGKITNNVVILKGGATVSGKTVGGGTASSSGGTLLAGAIVSGNSVTLGGATVANVYGAEAYDLLPVSGNSVLLDGGTGTNTVSGTVLGADINTTASSGSGGNFVTIKSGTNSITGLVAGARNNQTGNAGDGNKVSIEGGTNTLGGNVYGLSNIGNGGGGNNSSVSLSGGNTTLSAGGISAVYNSGSGTVGSSSSVQSISLTGTATVLRLTDGTNGNLIAANNQGTGSILGNNTITLDGQTVSVAGKLVGALNASSGTVGAATSVTSVTFKSGTNTVTGDVYGSENSGTGNILGTSKVEFAGGTNEVGGNVLGGKKTGSGSAGDTQAVSFTGGSNTVKGSVAADLGTVSITGGTNTLGDDAATDTITANKLSLGGGTSAVSNIRSIVSVSDLDVVGGDNSLYGVVNISNLFTATGGVSDYRGDVNYTGSSALSFTGGEHNFLGNLNAGNTSSLRISSPEIVSFGGNLNASLADAVVSGGGVMEFAGSDSQSATLKSLSIGGATPGYLDVLTINNLNPTGVLTLTVQDGVTVSALGQLSVAENAQLDLGSGTLNLRDQSALYFLGEDGSHGKITGNQLNASGLVTFYFDGTETNLVNGDPILDFTSVNIGSGTELYSPWYKLEVNSSTGNVSIVSPKSYGDSLGELAQKDGFSNNQNYRQAGALMQRISDSGSNPALVNTLKEKVENLYELDPGAAEATLKQLIGEPLLNAPKASYDTALRVQGTVYGRLDHIRSAESITPPSAGSPAAGGPGGEQNRVWIGGFGNWAKQKNGNGVFGYDFSNSGFSLGLDREIASVVGLTVGISGSFSSGTMDVKDGRTTVDINSAGIGLYGSYTTQTGMFVDAGLNWATSEHEATVNLIDGGKKLSVFDVNTMQLGLRLGKTIVSESRWSYIPTIGLRYVRYKQDEFGERVEGNSIPGNSYGAVSETLIEIPLELRVQGALQIGTSLTTPELRVGWTYLAKEPESKMRVGFNGSGEKVELFGTKADTNYFTAGLGVKVDTQSSLDFFANYDLNTSKSYTGHQFSAGLGYQF